MGCGKKKYKIGGKVKMSSSYKCGGKHKYKMGGKALNFNKATQMCRKKR